YRRLFVPLLLLVLWQLSATARFVSARTMAPPSSVVESFWELMSSGALPHHLAVSLRRVSIGVGIGVTIGVCLALVAGLSRHGEEAIDATMQMLRAMPFLA